MKFAISKNQYGNKYKHLNNPYFVCGRQKLLNDLIKDLNSKSDDEFYQELVEAGIIFDDIE